MEAAIVESATLEAATLLQLAPSACVEPILKLREPKGREAFSATQAPSVCMAMCYIAWPRCIRSTISYSQEGLHAPLDRSSCDFQMDLALSCTTNKPQRQQ